MPIIVDQSLENNPVEVAAIDIIKEAMEVAGVLGQNEEPSSSEAQLGLRTLNNMLALWANDRTFAYTVTNNSNALVAGQASYTVGSGAEFNVTVPLTIDYAYIRLNGIDYPLKQINNQDYDSIAYKANQEFPQFYYYDKNYPVATIYIYGVPVDGMTLYWDTWIQLTQFSSITDTIVFPPGYEIGIIHNLAKMLAPRYGMSLTPEAAELAMSTLAFIKDRNLPEYVMKTEVGYLNDGQGYIGWRGY